MAKAAVHPTHIPGHNPISVRRILIGMRWRSLFVAFTVGAVVLAVALLLALSAFVVIIIWLMSNH